MCNQCFYQDGWFSTRDKEADPRPEWGDAIHLRLKRHVPAGEPMSPAGSRKAVLLLHGASANHRTFTTPNGLADFLYEKNFDPWLFDWRGSSIVTDCPDNAATLTKKSDLYNFNRAAREDVPAAINIMRTVHGVKGRIALVGHCMGAGVVAEAVASGVSRGKVDRVVVLALGLFYEAAIDSRLKSEERILERLALNVANEPCIDPRVKDDGSLRTRWPADLDRLYEAWPSGLRAHQRSNTSPALDPSPVMEMCNRLSFMYGMPYRHDNLASGIHDVPPGTAAPQLPDHFGGLPLKMYLHAARNLRAGQATPFEPQYPPAVTDDTREEFIKLDRVTLITGELNRLWHRDSIDRMHEWLCRGDSTALRRIRKHVLAKYAHQDLLWGSKSRSEVYPLIHDGLTLAAGAGGVAPSGSIPPSPV